MAAAECVQEHRVRRCADAIGAVHQQRSELAVHDNHQRHSASFHNSKKDADGQQDELEFRSESKLCSEIYILLLQNLCFRCRERSQMMMLPMSGSPLGFSPFCPLHPAPPHRWFGIPLPCNGSIGFSCAYNL